MKNTRHAIGKIVTAVVAAAVVVGAMMWLSGVFRRDKITPPTASAESSDDARRASAPEAAAAAAAATTQPIVVRKVEQDQDVEVVGSIQAETQTTLSARLVGNILEIHVDAGDAVRKGDVLVVLDSAAPKARVEQARQGLRSAEASLTLAQIQVDRLTHLAEANASSKIELDEWTARLNMAKADVSRSQQAIVEAETGLEDAVIRAPFDGIVIDRQAEPGEQAAPGKPLLTMYDPSRLRLEASVGESYAGNLKIGQPLAVTIDALSSQQRQGRVSQIVPSADPNSRSFLARVSLDDASSLYPGMFGRVRVPLGRQAVLQIPLAAVHEIGQVSFVNVVPNGKSAVERRAVRLGQQRDQAVEVLAGLSEGEQVLP